MTTHFPRCRITKKRKPAIPIIVALASAPALQRSPLCRNLGIFSDRVEVGVDEKIMEQLARGRKYAAGITGQEDVEEETPQDDGSAEPKPN